MGLADKFKKVIIDSRETLSTEDKAYCEQINSAAEEVRKNLLEKFNKTKPIYDAENLGYTMTENGYISRADNPYGSFERCRFTEIYNLRAIKNLMSDAESLHLTKIISYFENRYNITLGSRYQWSGYSIKNREFKEDIFGEKSLNTPFSYSEIIDCIKERTGGIDFVEFGNREFIELFRTYFYSFGNFNWVAKGSKLTISNFCNLYTDYSGRYEANKERFEVIQKGLNFFETGSLQTAQGYDNTMTNLLSSYFDFEPFEFGVLNKVKSLKIFKNGKGEIVFRDPATMQEFITFYELDIPRFN